MDALPTQVTKNSVICQSERQTLCDNNAIGSAAAAMRQPNPETPCNAAVCGAPGTSNRRALHFFNDVASLHRIENLSVFDGYQHMGKHVSLRNGAASSKRSALLSPDRSTGGGA